MTLINGLYQRSLNIQGVQHSLGSHEESFAHLDEALCLPELNHPQCEFDLESNFYSKEIKSLHLHPSPIQNFPFL